MFTISITYYIGVFTKCATFLYICRAPLNTHCLEMMLYKSCIICVGLILIVINCLCCYPTVLVICRWQEATNRSSIHTNYRIVSRWQLSGRWNHGICTSTGQVNNNTCHPSSGSLSSSWLAVTVSVYIFQSYGKRQIYIGRSKINGIFTEWSLQRSKAGSWSPQTCK